jgi:aminoglycoside 2''-phosphotransferase
VLVVNEVFVFRFPKYPVGVEAMAREIAVLNGLHGRLPLAIPKPEYVHLPPHAAVGESFMGYRLIPGEPLWTETLDGCDEDAVGRIADQLGAFLHELHARPYATVISVTLPVSDTAAEWRHFLGRVQSALYPHMRASAQREVEAHIGQVIHAASKAPFAPALRHGDFGTDNLLFDPPTQRMCGVVDFGGACAGDPAYDIASLLSSYGEAFVSRLEPSYPRLPGLLKRARLYQGTFALMEALFGVDNGDVEAFESGIAAYR